MFVRYLIMWCGPSGAQVDVHRLGGTIRLKLILAFAVALMGVAALPASASTLALNPTVNSTRWEYEKVFFQAGEYDPPIVVTTTGGTAPYTCAWQKVGGDQYQSAASPHTHWRAIGESACRRG